MRKTTSKRKASVYRPGERRLLGSHVRDGAKKTTLTTYSSSLQETSEVEVGEEKNVSCEALVASLAACPQLYPSTGSHCSGDVWPSGSVTLHAKAGWGKLPGLLHQGRQLPFCKHWQNNLLSNLVFIYPSTLSLTIRFWVSAKDESSVGDCECINTVQWLQRQIPTCFWFRGQPGFHSKYRVEEVDFSTSVCPIMVSGYVSTCLTNMLGS